jgi:hypothetical protein
MKNLIFSLLVFISLFSCKKEKALKVNVLAVKKEVNILLNDWHTAAAEANFEDYFNKLANISVFIGTDATENWNKKEFETYSKPHFDKGKTWIFKTLERNVYASKYGDFVWFDELLDTWMGTCRGSGVLEKINNSWKIKHYVLSVTIPNDNLQAVILAKKKKDSILLSKFKK